MVSTKETFPERFSIFLRSDFFSQVGLRLVINEWERDVTVSSIFFENVPLVRVAVSISYNVMDINNKLTRRCSSHVHFFIYFF